MPEVTTGFRTYPANLAERIRFIKRAQELGFSLDEIANLLMLEDGNDRQAIRDVAQERLLQVQAKLLDLHRMEDMLTQLIHQCASSTQQVQCPIIQALASSSPEGSKSLSTLKQVLRQCSPLATQSGFSVCT